MTSCSTYVTLIIAHSFLKANWFTTRNLVYGEFEGSFAQLKYKCFLLNLSNGFEKGRSQISS